MKRIIIYALLSFSALFAMDSELDFPPEYQYQQVLNALSPRMESLTIAHNAVVKSLGRLQKRMEKRKANHQDLFEASVLLEKRVTMHQERFAHDIDVLARKGELLFETTYGLCEGYQALYSDVEDHEGYIHRLARFVKEGETMQLELAQDLEGFRHAIRIQESRHAMLLERLELDELNYDEMEGVFEERLAALEERYYTQMLELHDSLAKLNGDKIPELHERVDAVEKRQDALEDKHVALTKQLRYTQVAMALALALKLLR